MGRKTRVRCCVCAAAGWLCLLLLLRCVLVTARLGAALGSHGWGCGEGREGRGTTKRSEQQQRQNLLTRLLLIVRAHAHADHTTSPPTPGLWQGGAEYMTAACGGEQREARRLLQLLAADGCSAAAAAASLHETRC